MGQNEFEAKVLPDNFILDFITMVLKHLKNVEPLVLKFTEGTTNKEFPIISNFDVLISLENARRYFKSRSSNFKYPSYHPNNYARYGDLKYIFNEFKDMLVTFDKRLNEEHAKTCHFHKMILLDFWMAFIQSLFGLNFSEVLICENISIGIGQSPLKKNRPKPRKK